MTLSNYRWFPYLTLGVNKGNWRRRGDGYGRVVLGPLLANRESLLVSASRLTTRAAAASSGEWSASTVRSERIRSGATRETSCAVARLGQCFGSSNHDVLHKSRSATRKVSANVDARYLIAAPISQTTQTSCIEVTQELMFFLRHLNIFILS